MKTLTLTALLSILFCSSHAQSLGDYRTKNSTGNWGDASSWEELTTFLILIPVWADASSAPSSSRTVYIRSGHTINLNGTANCAGMDLSGTVNLGSNTLNIYGSVTYNTGGKLVANGQSALAINGSGSFTLALDQTTPGTTNKLSALTINRGSAPGSGTVTLSNAVQLSGTLTLSGGTLQSGGMLTLLSSSSGTARIATIDSTKAGISGNVTVQRYIPGGDRDWRFLTAPVTTSSGINGAWQTSTFITGPPAGSGSICPSFVQNSTDKLDPTHSGNYSLYGYDHTTATWTPITNTLTTQLSPGKAFRLYYRGARAQGCSIIDGTNATPLSGTLSATGTVGKGTINIDMSASIDGWMLVGNPYPSSINWDATGWNTSRTTGLNNINNSISIYNPATNSYSAYVNGVSDGNGATGTISSGQSFFVKANNSTSSLTFKESYKTTGENNLFGKDEHEVFYVESNLNNLRDHVAFYQCEEADLNFQPGCDALKFAMNNGNMAITNLHDPSLLAIKAYNRRPEADADTFLLLMKHDISGQPFSLSFHNTALLHNTWVLLNDLSTGKYYPIGGSDTTFSFSPAGNAGQEQRFLVILRYRESSTLLREPATRAASFSMYPNPVSADLLTIQPENLGTEWPEVRIYDMKGVAISVPVQRTLHNCQVDVSGLAPGTYIATVTRDNNTERSLFIRK